MSGSARLRDSPRSGLIAAALCVLATAAVLITAPAVHSALRSGASGRQPLAPRLAALSDQELAQLLPKQSEFPASWRCSPHPWRLFPSRRPVFAML